MERFQSPFQPPQGDAPSPPNDATRLPGILDQPIQATAGAFRQSLEGAMSSSQGQLGTPAPRTRTDVLGQKKRSRVETPTQTLNDHAEEVTYTPRSTRIRNLFPTSGSDAPLGDMIDKLLEVAMSSIVLGRQTKKVQVDVNSAADVLVLIGAIHDRYQLDAARRCIFQPGRQTQPGPQAPPPPPQLDPLRALAANTTFDFQAAGVMDKLSELAAQVSNLTTMVQQDKPGPRRQPRGPLYALAASKHAPESQAAAPTRPPKSAGRPQARQTLNTITLVPVDNATPACISTPVPKLVIALNAIIKEGGIKLQPADPHTIQVKTIQRRPSNQLVLHLEKQAYAKALAERQADWLPKLSTSLELKPERHAVLMHGIPTTFDPKIEDHLEDLIASNGDMLSSVTNIRWLNQKAVEEDKKNYSSLLITMNNADHAALCVKNQVWYRYKKHRTELGRRAPIRCFNCLKTGHAASACPSPPLCPYCGEAHHAHTCKAKGLSPPKCTSCARAKQRQSSHLTIPQIFETHITDLAHSPFDPKCAVRIAQTLHRPQPDQELSNRSDEDAAMTPVNV